MLALCATVLSIMSCTGRLLRTACEAVSLGQSNTQFHRIAMFVRKGWRMVKSETRRDAEILVRNPSPRLFGKKFRDSKK